MCLDLYQQKKNLTNLAFFELSFNAYKIMVTFFEISFHAYKKRQSCRVELKLFRECFTPYNFAPYVLAAVSGRFYGVQTVRYLWSDMFFRLTSVVLICRLFV